MFFFFIILINKYKRKTRELIKQIKQERIQIHDPNCSATRTRKKI